MIILIHCFDNGNRKSSVPVGVFSNKEIMFRWVKDKHQTFLPNSLYWFEYASIEIDVPEMFSDTKKVTLQPVVTEWAIVEEEIE